MRNYTNKNNTIFATHSNISSSECTGNLQGLIKKMGNLQGSVLEIFFANVREINFLLYIIKYIPIQYQTSHAIIDI